MTHNKCKYYEATRDGDDLIIGKEINRKQALKRLKSGKDVWVDSTRGARSLVKGIAGNGAARHLNHGIGFYKHFHDGKHIFSGHAFYGNPVY